MSTKKAYIYIGLFGFLFSPVVGLASYLLDNPNVFLVGNFLSNSFEPFIEQNGAVINFNIFEFLILSLPYLLVEIVLGFFFFWFLYKKISIVGNNRWKALIFNIIGFYAGFAFVGGLLLLIGVLAWRNFMG